MTSMTQCLLFLEKKTTKKTQMESFIGNGNALKYKRGKIMESSMKSIQISISPWNTASKITIFKHHSY